MRKWNRAGWILLSRGVFKFLCLLRIANFQELGVPLLCTSTRDGSCFLKLHWMVSSHPSIDSTIYCTSFFFLNKKKKTNTHTHQTYEVTRPHTHTKLNSAISPDFHVLSRRLNVLSHHTVTRNDVTPGFAQLSYPFYSTMSFAWNIYVHTQQMFLFLPTKIRIPFVTCGKLSPTISLNVQGCFRPLGRNSSELQQCVLNESRDYNSRFSNA